MYRYIFILTALLFSLSLTAQVDRSKAPVSGPAPQVHIGEYQSFTLPNGLKVLVVENNKTPKITLQLSLIDNLTLEKDKAGYKDFMGDLWGKATQKRNAKQLSEEVDFIGANLSTSASNVTVSGLSKFTPELMNIFADVILNPTFPKDEFDKSIIQTKTGLKANESSPANIMANVSKKTIYGDEHPYGSVMTLETIENFTLEDCKKYYKDFVLPNNSILVIVGDITLAEAKKQVEKQFSNWKRGTVPTIQFTAPTAPKGAQVIFSNKDAAQQASIAIAYPVDLKPGTPIQLSAQVMNTILGGGGFQAKLFKNLRETKGYTYGAYSRLSGDILDNGGKFVASSEVKANVTDSALIEVQKEMQNMILGDFTQADIDQVKKTMAGDFSRGLESPSTIAGFAYSIERYGLPKDYYTSYLERLSKVTKEDVKNAALQYINPNSAYIFVVADRNLKQRLTKFDSDNNIVELDHAGKPVNPATALPANLTANDVISSYIKAIGGKEALSVIKDMIVTSEMAASGMTITNTYKYITTPEKPAFMMEVAMMGQVMQKMIFDGDKVTVSGPQGTQTLEEEQTGEIKQQAYPFLEAVYANIGITPTLEGIEKVNGRDAYKIKVTLGDAVTYSFYDVENGLKVKSVGTSQQGTQEVTFEDYRIINGLNYPFLSKTAMQGMEIEIKVKDVKTNTGLKVEDLK